MEKREIEDGMKGRIVRLENSIQIVSNVGFLLDQSKPLTEEQTQYATTLNEETKKLPDELAGVFGSTDAGGSNCAQAPEISLTGRKVYMRIDPELATRLAKSLEVMQHLEQMVSFSAPLTKEQMDYMYMLSDEQNRLNEAFQELLAA